MRELVKNEQSVTIIPQDFKNANKGKVLNVDAEGFRLELKYKPEGLIKNHICDFYSLTDHGENIFIYLDDNNNIVSVANPVKHRFLQRRKFTRIKFISELELTCGDISHKVRTLDLSAGGMKLQTSENVDIEKEYNVTVKLGLNQEVKCKYQLIRVEKGDNGLYTISGRFVNLSNIDKMTLIQFCMKKDMENTKK